MTKRFGARHFVEEMSAFRGITPKYWLNLLKISYVAYYFFFFFLQIKQPWKDWKTEEESI